MMTDLQGFHSGVKADRTSLGAEYSGLRQSSVRGKDGQHGLEDFAGCIAGTGLVFDGASHRAHFF